jgi:hypothetical protein
MERILQPPRTTLNVLDVGWLFMLIVVISDATPATNGRQSHVLCVLNSMEERCLLLPTILTPSRRLTKVRRTKVRTKRSLTEVRWKKVPKQRPTQARMINVPSQRRKKARLTMTTQTKIVFKTTNAGLDHPILPVDSGHQVSLLLNRLTQPHHPKRPHSCNFRKYQRMKRLWKTKILPTCISVRRPSTVHNKRTRE